MSSSGGQNMDDNSSNGEGDLVLDFQDHKSLSKYCLTLQEYDDKGVFTLKDKYPSEAVLGLAQIVHFFRRAKSLYKPHTIRDILGKYVEDVSIFEYSNDRMNLVTNFGERVDLSDPPITLFRHDRTVTLYLQNKKYLPAKEETAAPISSTSLKDGIIIVTCILIALVTPYLLYCLVVWEKEAAVADKFNQ